MSAENEPDPAAPEPPAGDSSPPPSDPPGGDEGSPSSEPIAVEPDDDFADFIGLSEDFARRKAKRDD